MFSDILFNFLVNRTPLSVQLLLSNFLKIYIKIKCFFLIETQILFLLQRSDYIFSSWAEINLLAFF